jgi:hypothetical protein
LPDNEKTKQFRALLNAAHLAGLEAARNARPRLTRVVQFGTCGAMIESAPDWASDDAALGYCGYAWVRLGPATSAFARWCKAQDMAEFGFPDRPCAESDPHFGGLVIDVDVQIPRDVDRSGQSYEIKMAYAKAFASVLQCAGYNARADGRLD